MEILQLTPERTALVAIDLQNLIVARPLQPRDGPAVVKHTAQLADALRAKGGFIVWVRVDTSADGRDRLHPLCDQAMTFPRETPPQPREFVTGLPIQPADHVITKRQWGAFYGTDLDLQLRRRGCTTILLTGIATCYGVESTARTAYELGYEQVLVEDAMACMTAAGHEHAVTRIFPRFGRVRSTAAVLAALA